MLDDDYSSLFSCDLHRNGAVETNHAIALPSLLGASE